METVISFFTNEGGGFIRWLLGLGRASATKTRKAKTQGPPGTPIPPAYL